MSFSQPAEKNQKAKAKWFLELGYKHMESATSTQCHLSDRCWAPTVLQASTGDGARQGCGQLGHTGERNHSVGHQYLCRPGNKNLLRMRGQVHEEKEKVGRYEIHQVHQFSG